MRGCWRGTTRATGSEPAPYVVMYYVGLMSGTSADAIDAALVDISGDSLELIDYRQYPLDADVQRSLRRMRARHHL